MIRSIPCVARAGVIALAVAGWAGVAAAQGNAAAQPDPWPELASQVFKGRVLADGSALLAIEMPARAEDAAIVPVTVRATLPAGDARRVRAFTIVVDENPAPVAAIFRIGPRATVSSISTRVRVNSYTNVHAVAELSDGNLYMVQTYVKASGGCSAPASKNAEQADLGQLRFRQFARASAPGPMREAQIMIRHPNNSGLQMDQVSRLYTPAYFVETVKIWQGEELLLAVEGSIAISEDPNIRFSYAPSDTKPFRVEVTDTKNRVFKGEWPFQASGT
ncbi:MAG TPA: quinoprotein dehydrogenase-associated SoxYZ-like carrier [Xanthobacteraceae bacterium]|jgi:sulfur-oxidizing protein SoxY